MICIYTFPTMHAQKAFYFSKRIPLLSHYKVLSFNYKINLYLSQCNNITMCTVIDSM